MRTITVIAILFATTCLFNGQQLPSDTSIANLKARAEAGEVAAQLELAHAYSEGVGVPRNEEAAFRWNMKAAEAGNADGENGVALAYRTGQGVDKDFSAALKWYRMAAQQGNANAMFNVGTHYYNGDGIPVDDIEACAWFGLAKSAGSKRAEEAVARAEKELSPQQLTEAKLRIADMLAEGKLVPRDARSALATYEEAGRYGKPEVQLRLAKVFLNGWGVPEDPVQAAKYCQKALSLEKEYTPAMLCLAFLYQSERIRPQRGDEAISWYDKAYKLGNPVAAYGLGVAYATGRGAGQNFEKALQYLVIAAVSNVEVATPLAKLVEQKLSPEVVKKVILKANQEKRSRSIYAFGLLDKQFAYVVKVDHLP